MSKNISSILYKNDHLKAMSKRTMKHNEFKNISIPSSI